MGELSWWKNSPALCQQNIDTFNRRLMKRRMTEAKVIDYAKDIWSESYSIVKAGLRHELYIFHWWTCIGEKYLWMMTGSI